MINLTQLIAGFLLAGLAAGLAWQARSLTIDGAAAAAVLGGVVFGLGGLAWAVLLLGFFITSSGLSRLARKKKMGLDEKFSKGSRRDSAQVLANGGAAGLFVLLQLVFPGYEWPWLAFAGSLAAANADTWATELGVLSRSTPHLITTGQPVERGTSGGITLEGTLAAAAGALFIALLAASVRPGLPLWSAAAGIAIAGLLGSLADSLLGATVQAIYSCPTCRKETERHPLHTCGSPTALAHGLPWLNNDMVNTACCLAGGLSAVLMVTFLQRLFL